MNILVLSDNFMPLSNAERVAYLMTKEYDNLNNTVTVITVNSELKNGEINELEYTGLKIYQIGSSYNRFLIGYYSLYNPWVLSAVKIILNKNNYDFAHIHNIHAHISYGVIPLLKKKNIKMVMTLHDYMSVDYGKFTQGIRPQDLSDFPIINKRINPFKTFMSYKRSYNPVRNIIIKFYLNKVDKIVTVSKEQESILNTNGVENTITINNGILKYDISLTDNKVSAFRNKYNIQRDEKIMLWAGRLSDAKGACQVIKLVKLLIKNNYKVKLLIAGKDIFKGHELEEHIIATGWLDSDGMKLAYKISDLTLVPSIYPDPFPTVVLESMQAGVPVVATCFGGAKDAVVNEKTGYVINPFNINTFYKKVSNILNNDNLKKEMSLNSKEVFEKKFRIDNCINMYLELVHSL